MAWTAPKTWTEGEILDAVELNAELRDNLLETAPGVAQQSGDIFVADGPNSITRLGIESGEGGYYLKAKSSEDGVEWVAS